MAEGQIKRFERWRKRLPKNTAYLVSLVVEEVVPIFESKNFKRHPDYAGNSTYAIGPNCIPLQRRSGAEWPTVELLFHKRRCPSLGVNFALLPEKCLRIAPNGPMDIPRIEANVVEGARFLLLCRKPKWGAYNSFGYRWFALRPKRKIHREVDDLKSLLPHLFNVFDEGIPESWLTTRVGFVDQHVFMNRGAASLVLEDVRR